MMMFNPKRHTSAAVTTWKERWKDIWSQNTTDYLLRRLPWICWTEINEILAEQVREQLHKKSEISILFFLCFFVHHLPSSLRAQVDNAKSAVWFPTNVTLRFWNFSVSKLFHFFMVSVSALKFFDIAKMVSVSVSKNIGIEKSIRFWDLSHTGFHFLTWCAAYVRTSAREAS